MNRSRSILGLILFFYLMLRGAATLAFGSWALLVSEPNAFFLVFVVPGALLLIASVSRRAA